MTTAVEAGGLKIDLSWPRREFMRTDGSNSVISSFDMDMRFSVSADADKIN